MSCNSCNNRPGYPPRPPYHQWGMPQQQPQPEGCQCCIKAGDGITVEGDGSCCHPFIISCDCGDGGTAGPDNDTTYTMTDNGDGTFTHCDSDGNCVTLDICSLLSDSACTPTGGGTDSKSTFTDNNDGTITHCDGDGTCVTIDICSLCTDTLVDNGDGSFTHTAVDGTVVTIDTCAPCPQAELVVTKTEVSTGPYQAGQTIDYSIVVGNVSSIDAINVVLTDILIPPGVVTSDPDLLTGAGLPLLAAGMQAAPVTYSYTVTAQDVAAGSVVNLTTANADNADPVNDLLNTPVGCDADLGVSKVVTNGPGPFDVGDDIAYQIIVTNNSQDCDALNVTLSDPGLDAITSDPDLLTTAGLISLAPGASAVAVTGTHSVTAADVAVGIVLNTATANADNAEKAFGTALAPTAAAAPPCNAALSTVKTITSGPGPYNVGDTVAYSVVVTNDSVDCAAENVTLADSLGAAITVTADPDLLTTTGLASLAPGASAAAVTYTYVVTATDDAAGAVMNTATASASNAPDADGVANAPVGCAAELGIVKTETSTGPYNIGQKITYSVVVSNASTTCAALVVTLADSLAPNITVTSDPDALTGAGMPSLAASSSAAAVTYEYTVTAADLTAGQVVNIATASANNAPDVTDTITTATCEATVETTKVGTPATFAAAGETINYVITVTNISTTCDAVNVVVADPNDPMNGSRSLGIIAAGGNTTFNYDYTTTAADVTAGEVVNTATTTADNLTATGNILVATETIELGATEDCCNEATTTIDLADGTNFSSSGYSGATWTDFVAAITAGGCTVTYEDCTPDDVNFVYGDLDKDLVNATFHGAILKLGPGAFAVTGHQAAPDGSSNQTLFTEVTPANGYNYTGTPLLMDARSHTGAGNAQHWLLTTTGLYVWGEDGNSSFENSPIPVTGTAFQSIPLPVGVAPGDVVTLDTSKGTATILTSSGQIYVATVDSDYFDNRGNTVADANGWYQVQDCAGGPFGPMVEISTSDETMFAMDAAGNMFVWGDESYLADNTGSTAFSCPTAVTALPGGVTPVQLGAGNDYLMVLGSDGCVYHVGENSRGQGGQGNGTDTRVWNKVKDAAGTGFLTDVVCLETHESGNGWNSNSAITSDGTLYSWGQNSNDMIGAGGATWVGLPVIPDGFVQGTDVAIAVSAGGHITPYINAAGGYCNVGHNEDGAFGDGTTSDRDEYECNDLNVPTPVCKYIKVEGMCDCVTSITFTDALGNIQTLTLAECPDAGARIASDYTPNKLQYNGVTDPQGFAGQR